MELRAKLNALRNPSPATQNQSFSIPTPGTSTGGATPRAPTVGVAEGGEVAREADLDPALDPDKLHPNVKSNTHPRVFEVGVPSPAALPEGGLGAKASTAWPHLRPTSKGRHQRHKTTRSCTQ